MKKAALLLACIAWTTVAAAQDARGPVETVDAFDHALASGSEAKARALLASDVLIFESGGQEGSLNEYAKNHLAADIAFMGKMKRRIIHRRHGEAGEMAYVATRSRMTGTDKDKPIDLFGTETFVLRKDEAGWKIVHIQWSSRPVEPKKP